MPAVDWSPTSEQVERANVTRFMRAHGIDTYEDLVARSIADIEWFWDAVVRDLDIGFMEPYDQVLDTTNGVEWATWFGGGRTNVAHQCVDVWAERTPDAVAVAWEAEDGEIRRTTYAKLRERDRAGSPTASRRWGSGRGTPWGSSCRWRSRPSRR